MTAAPPLIVVVGATATGKTALAIELAVALRAKGIPAEIISADSRQVYRGLDIGTAKASRAERDQVPHHGLDLVDPDEPFTLVDFVAHVDSVLPRIADAGGVAILVGGTGLYLRAVARGLDTSALPSDREVRTAIERALADDGLDSLVARLQAIAPTLAAEIDLRNPRRVVRALEIAELSGDRPRPPARGYAGDVRWLGLRVEPDVHRARITDRARAQFAAGLLDEAATLRQRYDPAPPAFSAIGYREAWAVLDGEIDVETAIARDATRNVQFAKRQATWFRAEPDIEWLDASVELPVVPAQDRIAALVARSERTRATHGR